MNKLAMKLQEKNYFFRRLFEIGMDYLWIRKYVIFQFNLDKIDFSKKHEKIDIHWYLATIMDCEKWFQEGICGFETHYKKTFINAIRDKNWILFGDLTDASGTRLPCCHAGCNFHRIAMPTGIFLLEPKEGFMYSGFVIQSARCQGVGAGYLHELCRLAKEQGFSVLYSHVLTSNIASLLASKKSGGVLSGNGFYELRILKKSYLFPFGKLTKRFVKSQ